MNGGGVEIDTTNLERFTRRLAAGLDRGGEQLARGQAEQTAGTIRSTVPRRTGRLAGSVSVSPVAGGYAVLYGPGLPYARYIEKRSHAVANATSAGKAMYRAASIALAAKEVRKA